MHPHRKVILAALLSIAIVMIAPLVLAQDSATITLTSHTMQVGESAVIEAHVECEPQCGALSMMLWFDPHVIEVESVEIGNYLGQALPIENMIDSDEGVVHLAIVALGTPPVPESDVLFTMQIRAIAVGTTQFDAAELQLSDLNANALNTAIIGGTVSVQFVATATPTATRTSIPSTPTITPTLSISYVVFEYPTIVYDEPGVQYSPIGQFTSGQSAKILATDSTGAWYKVPYRQTEGWVPVSSTRGLSSSSLLSRQFSTATQAAQQMATALHTGSVRVNVQSANLRSGPGTNYRVISSARLGTEFPVIAQAYDSTWYLIMRAENRFAWISANVASTLPSNLQLPPAATIPAP